MSRLRIAHIILSRGFAGSERATAEMCNAHCEKHDVLLIIKKGHANQRRGDASGSGSIRG